MNPPWVEIQVPGNFFLKGVPPPFGVGAMGRPEVRALLAFEVHFQGKICLIGRRQDPKPTPGGILSRFLAPADLSEEVFR